MRSNQRQHWMNQYRQAIKKDNKQRAEELAERLGINLRRSVEWL